MAQHHVQVLVSRENFFKNIQFLRRLVAPANLCVVMKANAYGHGLGALAPVAVEAGANMLGICTNPEAETIRRIGLKVPLLRLRMALEAEMEESVRELDVQEQVGSREAAAYLASPGKLITSRIVSICSGKNPLLPIPVSMSRWTSTGRPRSTHRGRDEPFP